MNERSKWYNKKSCYFEKNATLRTGSYTIYTKNASNNRSRVRSLDGKTMNDVSTLHCVSLDPTRHFVGPVNLQLSFASQYDENSCAFTLISG